MAFVEDHIRGPGGVEDLRRIGLVAVELVHADTQVLELRRGHAADRLAQHQLAEVPRVGDHQHPRGTVGQQPFPQQPAGEHHRRVTDRFQRQAADADRGKLIGLRGNEGFRAHGIMRRGRRRRSGIRGRRRRGRHARPVLAPVGIDLHDAVADGRIIGKNCYRLQVQRLALDQLPHVGLGHRRGLGANEDHRRAAGDADVRRQPGACGRRLPVRRESRATTKLRIFSRPKAATSRCANVRGGMISQGSPQRSIQRGAFFASPTATSSRATESSLRAASTPSPGRSRSHSSSGVRIAAANVLPRIAASGIVGCGDHRKARAGPEMPRYRGAAAQGSLPIFSTTGERFANTVPSSIRCEVSNTIGWRGVPPCGPRPPRTESTAIRPRALADW